MARIKRKQRQIFDEGAFEHRLENSRAMLSESEVVGMVTLESAVHAAYMLTLRTAIKAQGTLYRRQVKQIKDMLRDMIAAKTVEKGVLKGLKRLISAQGKKLFGHLMKQVTTVLDYWKSAKANLDLEEAVRGPGLTTMLDLIDARLVAKKHRKTKEIFSRIRRKEVFRQGASGKFVVKSPPNFMLEELRKIASEIEGRPMTNREVADYMKQPANVKKMRKGFDAAVKKLWPNR